MTAATLALPRFRATRDEAGTLTVHRVPVFAECERSVLVGKDWKRFEFDAEWLDAAITRARQAEAEGYLPPLHVRHHEQGNEVRAAGFFRLLGTEEITLGGTRRRAVLADLVITDPLTQADVEAGRLPYRSVEIHNAARPRLNSLALLDHEVPYLELPLLMVDRVINSAGVAHATSAVRAAPTFAAQFKRTTAALLFQMADDDKKLKDDERMPTQADADAKSEAKTAAADDVPPKAGDAEPEAKASTPAIADIVKAIKSGAITVADLRAVMQAIQEAADAAAAAGNAEQEVAGDQQAKAPAPQQMRADRNETTTMTDTKSNESQTQAETNGAAASGGETVQMAALKGKLEGEHLAEMVKMQSQLAQLQDRERQRDALEKRNADVNAAMVVFDKKPVGDLVAFRARITSYHEQFGAEAFKAFVGELGKGLGDLPAMGSGDGSTSFKARGKVPPAAMKFAAQGPDAVERAAKFCADWERQTEAGLRVSLERYLAINMAEDPLHPQLTG